MKIGILGAGIGGSVLALELQHSDVTVDLLDVDYLQRRFNSNQMGLHVEFSRCSPSSGFQTRGYGFGGTSNLWHSVLTTLDEEDLDSTSILSKSSYKHYRGRLERYFGSLDFLFERRLELNKFSSNILKTGSFIVKRYIVKTRPTRFRKYLIDYKSRINIVENCVVKQLNFSEDGTSVESVLAIIDGQEKTFKYDIIVLACGSLETPRILNQSINLLSPLSANIGKNLTDHPSVFIGELRLPAKIFYRSHGSSLFSFFDKRRLGYTISQSARGVLRENHAIQLRPVLDKKSAAARELLKRIIYNRGIKDLFKLAITRLGTKVLFSLILEKIGFGQRTDRLEVSLHLEQLPNMDRNLVFQKKKDKYGRNVVKVNDNIGTVELEAVSFIQNLIKDKFSEIGEFVFYSVKNKDFISGSHYSGTCRSSTTILNGVVDHNLKVHGVDNLYISDASVFSKIGNSNLGLSIATISIKLSDHLVSILKRGPAG